MDMSVFTPLFQLLQIVLIPLLLLIWNELRETRKEMIANGKSIVELQTQMKQALNSGTRLAKLEEWRNEHEAQYMILMGEFRALQEKVNKQ